MPTDTHNFDLIDIGDACGDPRLLRGLGATVRAHYGNHGDVAYYVDVGGPGDARRTVVPNGAHLVVRHGSVWGVVYPSRGSFVASPFVHSDPAIRRANYPRRDNIVDTVNSAFLRYDRRIARG